MLFVLQVASTSQIMETDPAPVTLDSPSLSAAAAAAAVPSTSSALPPQLDDEATSTASTDSLSSAYNKKKRKTPNSVNTHAALNSATNALDTIVTRLNSSNNRQPDHIDAFFQSLAAQFRFIPLEKQGTIMADLQNVLSSAFGVRPNSTQ